MPGWNRPLALLLTCFLCSAVVGCGSQARKVSLHGKITNQGQPLTTSAKGFVQILFHPVQEGGKPVTPVPAVVDSQAGSYVVDAIPVGQYKVVVQQMDPAPVTDKLKGAFSLGRTNLVRDVKEDGELNIDLAKP